MPWSDYPFSSLTLPQDAGPNDDAIILDPAPPGCLGTRYAAAIVWRQFSPAFRGQFYIGVVKNALVPTGTESYIERGFMLDDPDSGACWIYVTGRWHADMGPTLRFEEIVGNLIVINGPAPSQPFLWSVIGNSAVTGTATINGGINWGPTGSPSTGQFGFDTGGFASSSTTYTTAGAPLCGVGFVTPPSGKMMLHYGGRLSNTGGGASSFIAFQLNVGSTTVGGGSPAYGNTDDDAVEWESPPNYTGRFMVSRMITANPGELLNAFLTHRCQSGTSTYSRRVMFMTPVI